MAEQPKSSTNRTTASARHTRSATAKMQTEAERDQRYEIPPLARECSLTPINTRTIDVSFRVLDLPIAIRQHIYRYAIGHRLIHIIFAPRKSSSRSPKAHFVQRICGDQAVVDQWEAGNMGAVPRCAYTTEDDDVPQRDLSASLLRASKRVYEEAGRMLVQDNIFAFEDSAPFDDFLLQGPTTTFRKANLTRLAIVITPKSRSTHLWNGMLGELYLPHGTMSSPDAQFPSLRSLQLYLTNGPPPWPKFKGNDWTSLMWIWGFMYFALESLEVVSVVSKDYSVRDTAESGAWRSLNDQEQTVYESMVQERLLREWDGGDQDDIELIHTSYYMKTGDCIWREEGEGALPWAERY